MMLSLTNRRSLTLLVATTLSCLGPRVHAGTPSADAFLLLPIDAREIALGQATVALVDDATAFHWNPAGVGMIESFDAAASYSRLYGGLAGHQMVAAGLPLGHRLAMGLSWVRFGVEDIPIYPALPDIGGPEENKIIAQRPRLGSFVYAQNALFLSFAWRYASTVGLGWQYLTLPVDVPVGVSVKYLTVSAGDTISASGIGVDLGAQFRFPLSRALDNQALGDLSLGITLADVGGTRLTWDTPTERTDKLTMSVRYGMAYEQPVPFLRSSVVGVIGSTGGVLVWGLEYVFTDRLYLRVGRDMISETGTSVGAGVAWRWLRLDYALQRHDLGASHRVSVHFSY